MDQKNNANEVPKWFSDMGVPELLLPPDIIRMFGLKTAIFAQKYAFLGTYKPCRLMMPYWLVGWWLWCAGCISQDSYLLIIVVTILIFDHSSSKGMELVKWMVRL